MIWQISDQLICWCRYKLASQVGLLGLFRLTLLSDWFINCFFLLLCLMIVISPPPITTLFEYNRIFCFLDRYDAFQLSIFFYNTCLLWDLLIISLSFHFKWNQDLLLFIYCPGFYNITVKYLYRKNTSRVLYHCLFSSKRIMYDKGVAMSDLHWMALIIFCSPISRACSRSSIWNLPKSLEISKGWSKTPLIFDIYILLKCFQ